MTDHRQFMLEQAKQALKNAYAPYSKFQVAACIKVDAFNFFIGCNVENASYSLTQCAEANAIGTMITHGHRQIQEILILNATDKPCAPCGACRQLIAEFAQATTIIYLATPRAIEVSATLQDFLPNPFLLTTTTSNA